MIRKLLAILLLLCVPSFATTYYVDFATGADTNNGTSTVTPFKHAPGMLGCANTCAGITPAGDDNYYFKGGVTWPNAALGMLINNSGTAGHTIYYGVLNTYFAAVTGTANTDATGKIVTWVSGVHSMGDFATSWVGQTVTVNSNPCLVNSVTAATWNTNGTMASNPTMTCNASVGTNLTGTAFSASIWSKPVFTAGGTVMGSNSGQPNCMVYIHANYIIFDTVEMTGLFWTGTPAFGASCYLQFTVGSPLSQHVEAKNLFIHGWSHGTNAGGTQDTILVVGDTAVPNENVGSSIHDSFITGIDTDRTLGMSGVGIFGGPPIMYRNWNEYNDDGFVGNGITTFHDNVVTNFGTTFQTSPSVAHTNGFEANAQSTDYTVYNNVISHVGSGALTLWTATNSGVNAYAFNNVFFDTDVGNILDPAQSVANNGCAAGATYCNVAGNNFYYNNTVECGPDSNPVADCQGSNSALTAITHQNNHYITTGNISNAPPTATLTTNLKQSKATANGQGYTAAQTFAFFPTTGGSTIGAGTSLTSFCSTVNALDATAGAACLLDTTYGVSVDRTSGTITGSARTPNTRKATPDIGAFEFTSGGVSNPPAPARGMFAFLGDGEMQ